MRLVGKADIEGDVSDPETGATGIGQGLERAAQPAPADIAVDTAARLELPIKLAPGNADLARAVPMSDPSD